VALIASQNVIPAPTKHVAPAPIRHVAPALIKHAASEKATPSLTQYATPIRHVIPTLIKHATPKQTASLISQNVTSIFSQNAILIISLFKKKFFQSDSQHLIVCLIIISTLPAREIG
jgi:hypothetical protein